jgi:hypothetical protein
VTNSGTVNGTSAATVEFFGTWDNTNGSISVDSSSSLYLGQLESTDPNYLPTLADGSAYAWNLSTVGSINVANGGTIGFGGLMTTDQLTAFPSLPGVSINLSQDTVLLDGWLDNSPADNPVTGGVLAFTSATGPVNLAGGFISQGTIITGGTGVLNVNSGILGSVTNNGAVVVPGNLQLEGPFTNNGTLTVSFEISPISAGTFTNNGSINLAGGVLLIGSMTNNGTIALNSGFLQVAPQTSPLPVTLTNAGTISATNFSELQLIGGLRGRLKIGLRAVG